MVLEVKSLYKNFNSKEVLKGVSFSVESGSALGLLGRNGAGKTTTIRLIMQLFNPTSGEVLLDGKPLSLKEVNIGYMPEERGLYPKKKVIEQLIYFGELKGLKRSKARERALLLLDKLEMSEYTNAKLTTLSKGNQQKIQLVATLISDPDIVILDEPFSGLDPVNAILLKNMVKELITEGKIVIFSSHQMNYIEEFCDSIVILNDGVIAVGGKIKDIKKAYNKNEFMVYTENTALMTEYVLKSGLSEKVKTNDEGLIVRLKDGAVLSDLLKAIAESEIEITGAVVYEPSMNDIFVEYTGGEEVK